MVHITMNGLPVEAERGSTLLEVARFYNFPIPTLGHEDGLNPYGACRLCLVEIGEASKSKLVAACGYRVEEGMTVLTNSVRVQRAGRWLQPWWPRPSARPWSSRACPSISSASEPRWMRFS